MIMRLARRLSRVWGSLQGTGFGLTPAAAGNHGHDDDDDDAGGCYTKVVDVSIETIDAGCVVSAARPK
jgi:hypothetical protein